MGAERNMPAVPQRGRRLRRVLRWIGAVLTLFLLLLAGAFGALQTDPGKSWLAATLSNALGDAMGFDVRVGAIRGTVPTDMAIASLEIADAQGVWLSARGVGFSWRPLDLLGGMLSVERITAESIDIARLPATEEPETPPAAPVSFELPGLPFEVAVADIEIAEIRLGADLIGEEVIAALFGSARLGGAPRDAELALNLLRLDGVPARIELLLSQAPDSGAGGASLTLQAEIDEPAGGLIARLLDLPDLPAVALRLAGSGPADGWEGSLTAAAGDARADLDIALALGERVDLALAGEVDPGSLAGAGLRDLLPSPFAVDAAIGVAPGTRLELGHAELSAPGLDAHLAGVLDQESDALEATVELAVRDPALIARLADPVQAAALRASARISGTLAVPTIDLDATLDGVAVPGASAEAVSLAARATPAAGGTQLDLSARLAPRGLAIEDDAVLGSLIGDAPSLELDGVLGLDEMWLDIASLDISTATLRVRGGGRVAAEGRDLDLALVLRVDDLAPFAALAGEEMSGALDAALTVTGDATLPRLEIAIDAAGTGVALADPLLAAIVGATPGFAGDLTVDGETIVVTRSELATALATARATGSIGDVLELSIDLSAPSLAGLSAPLGVDLAGGVDVAARVSGPLADPAVAATANGQGMRVAGIAVGDPVADISLAGLTGAPPDAPPDAPRGRLDLTAAPGGVALSARTAFRIAPDGGVAFDGLAIEGDGGTRLSGDLAVDGSGLLSGALDGEIADLSAWQHLPGTPLAGALGLRVTAEAAGGAQRLAVGARARALAVADAVTVAGLELVAGLEDAFGAPALDAGLTAEGIEAGGATFDTARLTARGRLADLAWTLVAASDGESSDGAASDAPEGAVDAAGRLALTDAGATLTLSSLDARLSEVEMTLARPATVAWSDAGVRVDALEAMLGDGRITASGALDGESMRVDATLADLPIRPIAALIGSGGLDGRLSGRVALAGASAAPQGSVILTVEDLREAGVDPAEAVALAGEASATLAAGRVDATARLFGPTDLALDARVSAPLAGDGPLSGTVAGGLDLALLPRIVDLRGDALSGRLDLDLAISGRRGNPRLDGRAIVANGAYESATQGTVLRSLSAELVGDTNRVRLVALSADDGNGGRLSGAGTMVVDPDAGLPIDAAVTVDRFTALRRSDATVQLSGELAVTRNVTGGRVAGRLTVDGAELRVPDRLGGEVVTLEVTEVNLPPGRTPKPPAPRRTETPLDLDVAVDIPGRAFLRGRGLDSEWRGSLRIGGTTAAPDIVGALDVVRGTLDLLGRTFRFDQGNVTFVGGAEIDPELDFVARSEAEAMTVEADVSGTASAPSFALSSEPPLPEDEILARLLFGSSAQSLTPIQAVQLAQTAASLSGRGSPVSVLDELRQGFGLDMLGVESGETLSSSSLAVGKYLTDDVFVKMNQGATPESRRIGVEVRVLPRVTVESDIGGESQGSVGVNWKMDY